MNDIKTKYKWLSTALLMGVIFVLLISVASCASKESGVRAITTYVELKSAISFAKDGDTLYVGDIDFTPPGTVDNHLVRLTINKNLTIKSAKKGKKALFTNGSFVLSGGKAVSEKIGVRFQDVLFDGGVDIDSLSFNDFMRSTDESGHLSLEPIKAQYAISFKGSVDAEFENCDFQNYMHEYGSIMHIRYGDYTKSEAQRKLFGDNSACVLKIEFSHCNIKNNAAGYDGGAIYIEGNNNVTLTADGCLFGNNRSSGSENSYGGGAIYAKNARIILDGCRVENNIGNYVYPDMELAELDYTRGGGLHIDNASLDMRNSIIVGNVASMGGGVTLCNSPAYIDSCVFTRNRAQTDVLSPEGDTGPWTNMAQGGAVYHEGVNGARSIIVNSSIYNNSAKTAYGGVYSQYSGYSEASLVCYLDIIFCNYIGNTCDSTYDYSDSEKLPWCTHPGDVWTIPYITATGCVILDDSFENDFYRNELPDGTNGYNYFADIKQAKTAGVEFTYPDRAEHLSLKADKNIDKVIPQSVIDGLPSGQYIKDVKEFRVGSNYQATGKPTNTAVIFILIGGIVVVVGVIVLLCLQKKKQTSKSDIYLQSEVVLTDSEADVIDGTDNDMAENNGESGGLNNGVQPERQIVKAWFTDAEVEDIFKGYPKIQTLTVRETEVLREMLEGKKQKEIAYDLGIEITTVKDFYRKIYDKLDFANKDDLLRRFSEIVAK